VRPTRRLRIASGVAHSLEEFVATAFATVGLNWQDHVDYDSSLARSGEIMYSLPQRRRISLSDIVPVLIAPRSN